MGQALRAGAIPCLAAAKAVWLISFGGASAFAIAAIWADFGLLWWPALVIGVVSGVLALYSLIVGGR